MTVVPTGGNVTPPLLACGRAAEQLGFADAVDPPFLVAVDCAVAEDAGAAGPDDPLLAGAEVVPDDPPHAASSRTNEPIPVAAAHPLLRITSLQFTGMTRPAGKPVQGLPAASRTLKRSRAVVTTGSGTLEPWAWDDQPPAMLLLDSLITCHTPPTPLPLVYSAFAPLKVYSGLPL